MTSSHLSVTRAAVLGFSALLVGLGLGRFGYPALIPALIGANWTSPEVAHVAAASNLAGYLAGAWGCRWMMRTIGPRVTIVACLWLTVASFALSAVPLSTLAFTALRLLSGMTGGALMTAVAPIVTLMVDPEKRGRAGGFAFAGIGIGFILSGTLVPALAGFGLTAAWLVISGILAIASLVGWIALPHIQAEPKGTPSPAAQAATNRAVLGLTVAYVASAIGYVPATVIFVDYVGRVLGLGLPIAGQVWAAAGLGAVVSPMIAGFVADRFGFAPTLRLVLFMMGTGAIIPALTSAPVLLAFSGATAAGMMIALASLVSGRVREVTPVDRHGAVWARLTVLFALAQAIAAYAVSGLLAVSADYALLFVLAGLTTLCGLAVEIVMSMRERTQV